MNIQSVREALKNIVDPDIYPGMLEWHDLQEVKRFIDEVEELLKHNSTKQIPALFKEKK